MYMYVILVWHSTVIDLPLCGVKWYNIIIVHFSANEIIFLAAIDIYHSDIPVDQQLDNTIPQ